MPGIGDAVHAGLDISRWSLLYYGSCVLLASFVLVNVLVGVVITSLDEARDMDEDKPPAEPPHTIYRRTTTRLCAAASTRPGGPWTCWNRNSADACPTRRRQPTGRR